MAPRPFSGTPGGQPRAAPDLHIRPERARPEAGPQLRRCADRQSQVRREQRTAEADVEQPDPRAEIQPALDAGVKRNARRLPALCP